MAGDPLHCPAMCVRTRSSSTFHREQTDTYNDIHRYRWTLTAIGEEWDNAGVAGVVDGVIKDQVDHAIRESADVQPYSVQVFRLYV